MGGGFHDYPSSEELERQTQKANKIRDRISGLVWMGQDGDAPYTLKDEDLLAWINPGVCVRVSVKIGANGTMQPKVMIEGTLRELSDPREPKVELTYGLNFGNDGNLEATSSGHIRSASSTGPHPQQEETFGTLQGRELEKWEDFQQAEDELGSRARTFPLSAQDLDMLDSLLEECYPFS